MKQEQENQDKLRFPDLIAYGGKRIKASPPRFGVRDNTISKLLTKITLTDEELFLPQVDNDKKEKGGEK